MIKLISEPRLFGTDKYSRSKYDTWFWEINEEKICPLCESSLHFPRGKDYCLPQELYDGGPNAPNVYATPVECGKCNLEGSLFKYEIYKDYKSQGFSPILDLKLKVCQVFQ